VNIRADREQWEERQGWGGRSVEDFLAANVEHDPGPFREGHKDCERSRIPYWLLSTEGEVTEVRCSSPNRCDPCARRRCRENAEMIGLDAIDHPDRAPEVWAVLTTREATLDMRGFYDARRLAVRALKRRYELSYASVLEYTTGYGERSGGQRRPHWNMLLKGIGPDDIPEAGEILRRVWCSHVDAEPHAQSLEPVWEVGGLAGYLAAHVHKSDQKPPPGFRGQRFNCARDYFEDATRAEMRERAAESIFRKTLLWRATEVLSLEGEAAAAWAEEEFERLRAIDWRLVRIGEGWLEGVAPRRRRAYFARRSYAGLTTEREQYLEAVEALENYQSGGSDA